MRGGREREGREGRRERGEEGGEREGGREERGKEGGEGRREGTNSRVKRSIVQRERRKLQRVLYRHDITYCVGRKV